MNEIQALIFCFLLILVHEIGHYVAARKEGIYKGWGLFPSPHIKLTQPFGSRWAYLSGFAADLLLFPYWVLTQGLGSWIFFLMFCVAGASIDIVIFIFYGWLMERRKERQCQIV